MTYDHDLDAVGLLCPLPVLRAAKRMRGIPSGQVLRLAADDPAAVVDVPHYCNESGNTFLGSEELDKVTYFFIRKA